MSLLNEIRNACGYGELELVKTLFKNVNIGGLHKREALIISCGEGEIHIIRWMYENKLLMNITNSDFNFAIEIACHKGEEMMRLLIKIKPRLIFNTDVLMYACKYGMFDIIQKIHKKKPSSTSNFMAFREACKHGHLDIAQWLLEVHPILIIVNNVDAIFMNACDNKKIQIAQWLATLNPDRYTIKVTGRSITYLIDTRHYLRKNPDPIIRNEVEKCPICDEADCNIQTSCKHLFCEPCIQTWTEEHNHCPYCRTNLCGTLYTTISSN